MRLFSDRTPDHPRSSGAGCAGRGDLRGGVADGPIHRYSVAASALPAILGHGQAPLLDLRLQHSAFPASTAGAARSWPCCPPLGTA